MGSESESFSNVACRRLEFSNSPAPRRGGRRGSREVRSSVSTRRHSAPVRGARETRLLAMRQHPHLQCASGLASPDRCAGSPHAARKPCFAPNPPRLAGEGSPSCSLSRLRERILCSSPSPSGRGFFVVLPLPHAGEGGGEGRRTTTGLVSPRTPGADRGLGCSQANVALPLSLIFRRGAGWT